MEHYRPKIGWQPAGYYQGYYCGRCGVPGQSMIGNRKHGSGICLSNPMMVKKLNEVNTEEAETKRKFIHGLKKGQPTKGSDWEYVVGGRKRKQ